VYEINYPLRLQVRFPYYERDRKISRGDACNMTLVTCCQVSAGRFFVLSFRGKIKESQRQPEANRENFFPFFSHLLSQTENKLQYTGKDRRFKTAHRIAICQWLGGKQNT
jgi:hypothetical protein